MTAGKKQKKPKDDGGVSKKGSPDVGFVRDIPEWDIPEAVLAVLLKDRSIGRNIIWATDDYADRGEGFLSNDEIQLEQIIEKSNPVIRPRIGKNDEEQHRRIA